MEKIFKTLGPTLLTLKEFGFAYGVQGILMRRNLEKLWLMKNMTQSDYNVFLVDSDQITANLKDLSDIGLSNPPFGIAEISSVKNTWNESYFPPKSKPIKHRIAKVTTIYEGDGDIISVKDLFYKKQRERKSWWRRITENPNIFHVGEIKQERGKEYVEIEARLPFGNIVVETIYYKPSAKLYLRGGEFSNNLKIVENITSLDWGCLALICDGYVEIDDCKEMQVHPNLAPYKAYSKANIKPEDNEQTRIALNNLSIHLIQLLREQGIETVLMNLAKQPEVFQVPYILTVDSESLKNGFIRVVSQRTLCGEIVHITKLAQHVYDLTTIPM
ncbi:DNA polymerase subunit gamma-2, mitochondrial [Nasonia vitripennis]|uniref:DNA polymerase subunit gamma-2, mitochondrial n=1 Tax=Nasonia vitripennis TaxID=7425 RepID=A0A7M7LM51_NASVI|nr:DNA polymerase subunit gamma-2, mitochondrial [Nasonia vitripennis]